MSAGTTVRNRNLMLLVWTGPIGVSLVFLGLFLAGFVPPPSPHMTDAQKIALWRDDPDLKRAGMIIAVWGGSLYATFTFAITVALRRIPGDGGMPSSAQVAIGVFATVFFSDMLCVTPGPPRVRITAPRPRFERTLIRERTNAGLAAAGAQGRVGGRKNAMPPTDGSCVTGPASAPVSSLYSERSDASCAGRRSSNDACSITVALGSLMASTSVRFRRT